MGAEYAVLMVFAFGLVGIGIAATVWVGYNIIGHNFDSDRFIEDNYSQRNGDVTVTMKKTVIRIGNTIVDLNIKNDGTSRVLFDLNDAVLVQDGKQYGSIECTGILSPCRGGITDVIYDGTSESGWIRFEEVKTKDFAIRLSLTDDEGNIIPFEIDVEN